MDDEDRTHEFLLAAMRKKIRKNQEKRLVQTRLQEMNWFVGQKATPLEDLDKDKKKKSRLTGEPKAKVTPAKGPEKPDPKPKRRAAPVYPSPSHKSGMLGNLRNVGSLGTDHH